MLDGGVFAGGIHCLEDKEQRPLGLGGKFFLQLAEGLCSFFELFRCAIL